MQRRRGSHVDPPLIRPTMNEIQVRILSNILFLCHTVELLFQPANSCLIVVMAVIPNNTVIVVGACSLLIYFVALGVYRVFLSPIAHIPGPLLAKLTYGYEFFYDVINRGQYIWKIRQLHERYGPIVRISPHEVHINDADFYDEIYAGSTKKRDKWDFICNSHGVPESAFGTSNHDLHRMRRAALNPFFSKQKVRALQPKIENVVENLLSRFEGFAESKQPLPLSDAFAALTYGRSTRQFSKRTD